MHIFERLTESATLHRAWNLDGTAYLVTDASILSVPKEKNFLDIHPYHDSGLLVGVCMCVTWLKLPIIYLFYLFIPRLQTACELMHFYNTLNF